MSPKKQFWNIPLLITAVVLSRLVARYFFDVRFDYNHVFMGWQFIDPALLKTRMLESIWYLHSQPPLMNLLTGIVLKLFPQQYPLALSLLFHAIGLLQVVVFYWSLKEITGRPRIAFYVTLFFAVSPAAILYESWYSYSLPVMALLSVSAACLIRLLRTRQTRWAAAFFSCLALISLTVSMFHIGWIVMVLVLLILLQRHLTRRLVLAALLPLVMVGAWYAKNQYLFGQFSASSWLGMNLARIMLGKPQQLALIQADTTERIAQQGPFKTITAYEPYLPPNHRYGNIPVLQQKLKSTGEPNYNHIGFLRVSDEFKEASLKSLKALPKNYAERVAVAQFLYFTPTTDYFFLDANRNRIDGYDRLYTLGGFEAYHNVPFANLVLIFLYALVFWQVFRKLWRQYRQRKKTGAPLHWVEVVVVYAVFNNLYLLLVGNFLEIGENMRFRFYIIPLFLLLAVYSLPARFIRPRPAPEGQ